MNKKQKDVKKQTASTDEAAKEAKNNNVIEQAANKLRNLLREGIVGKCTTLCGKPSYYCRKIAIKGEEPISLQINYYVWSNRGMDADHTALITAGEFDKALPDIDTWIDVCAFKFNDNQATQASLRQIAEAYELTPDMIEGLAEQPETLCTIGEQDLHTGDTFRLKANPQTDSATVEVNPTDNTRNPDKPNNWNAATREAYKTLLRACIGIRVNFTFTDDRRATITETATITGCGMDSTNDRATFTLSTGRKVASGYTFKAIGYDPDRRNGDKVKDMLIEAQLTAADIRHGIAEKEAKRDKLNRQIAALRDALIKAIEIDLAAIREALTAHPVNRKTLAAAIATPTANRIPAEEAEGLLAALKAVEGIPAAAAAVRATMETAHGEHAVYLMTADPATIANADEVAAVMKAHQVQLGDIPTDILP